MLTVKLDTFRYRMIQEIENNMWQMVEFSSVISVRLSRFPLSVESNQAITLVWFYYGLRLAE